MNFTPEEEAMGDRLTKYNGRAYNPVTEPYGFDRGGNQQGVFEAMLKDVAGFGRAILRVGNSILATIDGKIARVETAVDAIEQGVVEGPVLRVVGKTGDVSAADIAAALDLPAVRPAFTVSPANGSAPALPGGALVLAVSGFYSDYGKKQKSIRFQIDNNATFASPEFDQTFVTPSTSVQVANAQTVFQGGVTYYVRSKQTDEDDKAGDWSAATSFTFPVVPNAATMSAPADGAVNVGALNQPITFTASAYSHPNGVARASRVFQISKDNFATIAATVAAASGASSATLTPRGVLDSNADHKVRCVDTDANGGQATSAATSFKTVERYSFEKFLAAALNSNIAGSSTPASIVFGQDVETFQRLALPRSDGPGIRNAVAFSDDGKLLLLGGQGGFFQAWRRDADQFTEITSGLPSIANNQDVQRMSYENNTLALALSSSVVVFRKDANDVFTYATAANTDSGAQAYCGELSPSGANLVFGFAGGAAGRVFDVAGNSLVERYSFGLSGGISAVTFLDASRFFIGGTEAGLLRLFSVATSGAINGPSGGSPTAAVSCLRVSEDRQYLAVGQQGAGAPLLIYKVTGTNFTKIGELAMPSGGAYVRDLSWSKDGTYLAVGYIGSYQIDVWKRTGDTFAKIPAIAIPTNNSNHIRGVAFWPRANVGQGV